MGNVVMILIILSEKHPGEAVRHVFVTCASVLIPLSVLLIKYYPDVGRYYHRWTYSVMYCGVTTNKNSLGVLALTSGLFTLWTVVSRSESSAILRKAIWLVPELALLGMCLWLLRIADSATALGSFMVGSVVFWVSHSSWVQTNVKRLNWILAGVVLSSFLFLYVPDLRKVGAESLGRDATLTTRTDIWNAALNLGTSPLIGDGFASVWLTQKGRETALELRIPHAHNGYLETYLNTGLIGLALLALVLFSAGRNSARQLVERTATGNVYIAFFVIGVLYNLTEVTFNCNHVVGFMLWLICLRYEGSEAEGLEQDVASESVGESFLEIGATQALRNLWSPNPPSASLGIGQYRLS